jgi:sugar O-acyltransferase (sialic acid O-acetyltransferase NeuD family)
MLNSANCVYLYGAGGHAKVIADILLSNGILIKRVFADYPAKAILQTLPVEDGIRLLDEGFPQLDAPLILCVGNNARRKELAGQIRASFGTAIHRSAIIAPTTKIGPGTVVLHGSVIQTDSQIGSHVLINTAASVDHDNVIGDYAHVSPHATLCGHVQVGEGTHIGAGAVVIQCVTIGKWCTIGAGAVVLKDIPDFATAVGNPARIIKFREPRDL